MIWIWNEPEKLLLLFFWSMGVFGFVKSRRNTCFSIDLNPVREFVWLMCWWGWLNLVSFPVYTDEVFQWDDLKWSLIWVAWFAELGKRRFLFHRGRLCNWMRLTFGGADTCSHICSLFFNLKYFKKYNFRIWWNLLKGVRMQWSQIHLTGSWFSFKCLVFGSYIIKKLHASQSPKWFLIAWFTLGQIPNCPFASQRTSLAFLNPIQQQCTSDWIETNVDICLGRQEPHCWGMSKCRLQHLYLDWMIQSWTRGVQE